MVTTTRRLMAAAGLLSVAIGLERLANAMLVDGIASYHSTRFFVAVVCLAVGTAALLLNAARGLIAGHASSASCNHIRVEKSRTRKGERTWRG